MTGSILHVITDASRRGAQVFGEQLHQRSLTAGWSSAILALAQGTGDHTLSAAVAGPSRLAPRTLLTVRRGMTEADVAIAHGSTTLPACAMAGIGSRTPFIYRSIGDPSFWLARPNARRRTRLALGRAAHVVALWDGAADFYAAEVGLPRERIVVIPHAVPGDRFAPPDAETRRRSRQRFDLPTSGPVVTYIGSLTWEKDVTVLIEAVGRVPEVHLVIAGSGSLEGELSQRAREVAPDRVRFLGTVADPETVLAASDVLALASRTEGMPGVIIEAGLMAVPTVAPRVGGIPELVRDGETGILVADATPAALAEGLHRALGGRDELGAAARRRHVEYHTLDHVWPRWNELLASTVRSAS